MKITYNTKNINGLLENARLVLIDTAEAVKTDLIQSQTMPFDTGTMQNDSTFVDDKKVIKGVARIVVDTVYARKVFVYTKDTNVRCGSYAHWVLSRRSSCKC